MIEIIQTDITTLDVDAIVNAANSSLLGGGGVDGAIHRAAGPELLTACRALQGCATADAKLTPGFHLPARFVIHAVGPVWRGGQQDESQLLQRCYARVFALAKQNGVRSIAFPAISTGVYGFPKALAAEIALDEMKNHVSEYERIIAVCFTASDAELYRQGLKGLG